jgi:hypothetical protein
MMDIVFSSTTQLAAAIRAGHNFDHRSAGSAPGADCCTQFRAERYHYHGSRACIILNEKG